jgi:hypothetical protein
VTALVQEGPRAGETGLDALDRIGRQLLPPQKGRSRPKKLPRQLAAVIACRTEGMNDKEIAQALNLALPTVKKILQRARRDHGMDDLADRVRNRAVHTAVDNLIGYLDEGDRNFTKLVLNKTIFKPADKGRKDDEAAKINELRVVFEMPQLAPGQSAPQIAVGAIVGTPRRLVQTAPVEGEVADV